MGTTVYAASLQGRFNVPLAAIKSLTFQKTRCLCSRKITKATFTCLPFEKVFSRARRGNVIYCDPPYAPISKTAAFTSYAARSFGQESQEKLAELATRASKKRGIPVLISNHDLPLTRSLYHGADFSMLSVKRSISQNGAKRQPVDEILAYFPPANVASKRKTRKKKTFHRPSV